MVFSPIRNRVGKCRIPFCRTARKCRVSAACHFLVHVWGISEETDAILFIARPIFHGGVRPRTAAFLQLLVVHEIGCGGNCIKSSLCEAGEYSHSGQVVRGDFFCASLRAYRSGECKWYGKRFHFVTLRSATCGKQQAQSNNRKKFHTVHHTCSIHFQLSFFNCSIVTGKGHSTPPGLVALPGP